MILDARTKFMFRYATDLTKSPGESADEWVQFRSWVGFFAYVLRHKAARMAIRADRFWFIKVTRKRDTA